MAYENLVKEIQNGDQGKVLVLWDEVKNAVMPIFKKWCNTVIAGYTGMEDEDLSQEAIMVMIEAVMVFSSDKDGDFKPYLFRAVGRHLQKLSPGKDTPMLLSADTPLSERNRRDDDFSLYDTIPAPPESLVDPIEEVYAEQAHKDLDDCLKKLPEVQATIIKQKYYEDLSSEELAEQWNVPLSTIQQYERMALGMLRNPLVGDKLRNYLEDRTDFYKKWSVSRFLSTGESVVENIVFHRDKLARRRANATMHGLANQKRSAVQIKLSDKITPPDAEALDKLAQAEPFKVCESEESPVPAEAAEEEKDPSPVETEEGVPEESAEAAEEKAEETPEENAEQTESSPVEATEGTPEESAESAEEKAAEPTGESTEPSEPIFEALPEPKLIGYPVAKSVCG